MCSRGYLHYHKVWEGPGPLAVRLGTIIELVHEVFVLKYGIPYVLTLPPI